jgi:hypothetical protein
MIAIAFIVEPSRFIAAASWMLANASSRLTRLKT